MSSSYSSTFLGKAASAMAVDRSGYSPVQQLYFLARFYHFIDQAVCLASAAVM